ncbi:MAG: phosphatidylglycerophosphatase A [Acidobacteriaceae bacterium]|nr:phosphatidylglycerophosphatase A [Acidobacteriaceae bacterium]
MSRLAVLVATWFGCGYFPWGPGTVGSAAAVLIAGVMRRYLGWGRPALLVAILALLWPSIWSATRTARLLNIEDPGIVVVDEVLGQWVTLLGAAAESWKVFLAGFVMFRLFDIWKPWPVREFEKLPGGTGIVTDDLAAGVYGAAMLYLGGALKAY